MQQEYKEQTQGKIEDMAITTRNIHNLIYKNLWHIVIKRVHYLQWSLITQLLAADERNNWILFWDTVCHSYLYNIVILPVWRLNLSENKFYWIILIPFIIIMLEKKTKMFLLNTYIGHTVCLCSSQDTGMSTVYTSLEPAHKFPHSCRGCRCQCMHQWLKTGKIHLDWSLGTACFWHKSWCLTISM